MSNLDLAPGVTGAAVVTAGQTGPYTGTFPPALIDGDHKNLSPRGAIAWRPTPKRHIVLRAGYSIFYNGSIYGELPGHLASQPPFAHSNSIIASLDYALRLATGFTNAGTKLIDNSFAVDRYYKDGYAQTWNFGIETESQQSLGAGTKLHGHQRHAARRPARAQPRASRFAPHRRGPALDWQRRRLHL